MKKTKIPSLVTIAVFTTITVICWIAFDVIRIFTNKPALVNISPELLAPVNPTLDKDAVDKIRETIYFDKEQEFEVLPAPSASPEATPVASPTALPTVSPTASPSATQI